MRQGFAPFISKTRIDLPLEILEFPEDKGDPKWHRPDNRLFLGIDQAAFTVADTDASLRFYRDVLGLRVVGESENYVEFRRQIRMRAVRIGKLLARGDNAGFCFEAREQLVHYFCE